MAISIQFPRMNDNPAKSAPVWAVALVVILLCAYNLNFRHGSGVDTIPATAQPVSLLNEGNFDLDEFRALLSYNTHALDASLVYFGSIQERDGHLVSSYPLGAAVLAVPFFAVAQSAGYLKQWHHYRVVGKIAASTMVALSALFIFLALRLTIETPAAWGIAMLYGLGTSAWSISSQELWQHGPGSLCLAIAVYALCRMEREPSRRLAGMAGFFLGFAVYCRLLNVVPVGAMALFMLIHHRRYLSAFLLPLFCMAGIIVYYNLATFGNLSGGYDAIYQSKIHGWRQLGSHNVYSHPLGQGLADILLSPSRGLLIYSSFLLPAFAGAVYFAVRPATPLQRYLILWVALMSMVLAKNALWWGGATYGPRYFSETCVALTLLVGGTWPYLKRHGFLKLLFVAAGTASIFIHGIGAFFAPCGWEASPVANDLKPERHWEWRDPEIRRCLDFGLQHGFKTPEILNFRDGDKDF